MSSNALVKATYLADDKTKDKFYREVLQPAGIDIPPVHLFWPQPKRNLYGDVDISRPGSGWVFNEFGQLVERDADEVLRDYDPATGAFLGALAEPQAENLLTRNNNLADWSRGSGVSVNKQADFQWEVEAFAEADGEGSVLRGVGSLDSGNEALVYAWVRRKTSRYVVMTWQGGSSSQLPDQSHYATVLVDFEEQNSQIFLQDSGTTINETVVMGDVAFVAMRADLNTGTGQSPRFMLAPSDISVQHAHRARANGTGFYYLGAQVVASGPGLSGIFTSLIETDASPVIRPATTMTLPQVGDRRRGFIAWQGVMRFDPDLSGVVANQIQRFPFGRGNTVHSCNMLGETSVNFRAPAGTDRISVGTSSLQDRRVRIVYFWDVDAGVWGGSVQGNSSTSGSGVESAPTDNPIQFGQTSNNREGASHTDWIYISYNYPTIEQIEAFTGELAP